MAMALGGFSTSIFEEMDFDSFLMEDPMTAISQPNSPTTNEFDDIFGDVKILVQEEKKHQPIRQKVTLSARLSAPMMELRKQLEIHMNAPLIGYRFTLQGNKTLAETASISSECIDGVESGRAKIHFEVISDEMGGRINIMDVLATDPADDPDPAPDPSPSMPVFDDSESSTSSPLMESDESLGFPTPFAETDLGRFSFIEMDDSAVMADPNRFAEVCKTIDAFKKECFLVGTKRIEHWTWLDLKEWMAWMQNRFAGQIDFVEGVRFSGADVMQWSNNEFNCSLVVRDPQQIAWTHFLTLRKQQELEQPPIKSGLPSKSTKPKTSSYTVNTQKLRPMQKKERVVVGRYQQGACLVKSDGSSIRSGNNGTGIQLWKFLLDLLTDIEHMNIIQWEFGPGSEDGQFKMIQPDVVAALWGEKKSRDNMSYDKMSRALRYYKGGDILDKVRGKRFTYRFVVNLKQILGYEPIELHRRMSKQIESRKLKKKDVPVETFFN